MKPLIIHAEAQAELDAAAGYYEVRSEGLGLDFLATVTAAGSGAAKATRSGAHRDTGATYSLANPRDLDHAVVRAVYNDPERTFILHKLILVEAFPLLTKTAPRAGSVLHGWRVGRARGAFT